MKTALVVLMISVGLFGCMKTSEQIAQETAADLETCKRAGAPISECMANIRQHKAIQNAPDTCITTGNVTHCY